MLDHNEMYLCLHCIISTRVLFFLGMSPRISAIICVNLFEGQMQIVFVFVLLSTIDINYISSTVIKSDNQIY